LKESSTKNDSAVRCSKEFNCKFSIKQLSPPREKWADLWEEIIV
jgi:hypothetical protein